MSQDHLPTDIHAQLTGAQRAYAAGDRLAMLRGLRQLLTSNRPGVFWATAAQLFQRGQDLYGALVAARRFAASCPHEVGAKSLLAQVLGELGQTTEAVALAEQVVAARPDLLEAHYALGVLLARDGQLSWARRRFADVVAADPQHALALEYLALLADQSHAAELLTRVEKAIAANVDREPREQAALQYARAKLLELTGDTRGAFKAYRTGAALMASVTDANLPAMGRYVGRLEQSFTRRFFERLRPQAHPYSQPIFIIGMPRSGTTLVEMVLGAHSQVAPLGESSIVHLSTLPYRSFEPRDLALIEAAIAAGAAPWREMGGRLRQLYAERATTSTRFADKNLSNHFFLGVINLIASGAPVIYCKRDPVAVAWSCFSTRFTRGNAWSYDFDAIVRYQELHTGIMAHWLRVLPESSILELEYEQFVSQPTKVIKQILDHVALNLEPACLQPHTVRQSVSTASLMQVRRPIHTDAITYWRKFAKWLPPELERGSLPSGLS